MDHNISGEETWVLVHVEVQAQRETEFPHRMYVYHYRIHDLYQRPVASFAVLADDHATWRPSGYYETLWRTRTLFRFPVVKILDYQNKWEMLDASPNPFAIVVQAHLKTLETQKDDAKRSRWKITLTKALYKRGFMKADIVKLFRFIDWIMRLPEELERQYYREIVRFEEETRMSYMTIAERIGMEKGVNKGEVIGRIRLLQGMQNRPVSSKKELAGKGMTTLRKMLQHITAEEQKMKQKEELISKITLAQEILKKPVSTKDDLMEHSPEDLDALFQELQADLAKLK